MAPCEPTKARRRYTQHLTAQRILDIEIRKRRETHVGVSRSDTQSTVLHSPGPERDHTRGQASQHRHTAGKCNSSRSAQRHRTRRPAKNADNAALQ